MANELYWSNDPIENAAAGALQNELDSIAEGSKQGDAHCNALASAVYYADSYAVDENDLIAYMKQRWGIS